MDGEKREMSGVERAWNNYAHSVGGFVSSDDETAFEAGYRAARSPAPAPGPEWSTEKPTEPGWYWADDGKLRVVEVVCRNGIFDAWIAGYDEEVPLASFLRWLGPLSPPSGPAVSSDHREDALALLHVVDCLLEDRLDGKASVSASSLAVQAMARPGVVALREDAGPPPGPVSSGTQREEGELTREWVENSLGDGMGPDDASFLCRSWLRMHERIAADGVAQREDRIRDLERALAAAREAAERWRVHAATAERALAAKSAEASRYDRMLEDAEVRCQKWEAANARLRSVIQRARASLERGSPGGPFTFIAEALAILSEADAPPQARSLEFDRFVEDGVRLKETAPSSEAAGDDHYPHGPECAHNISRMDPKDWSARPEAAGAEMVRAMRAKRTKEDAEIVLRAIGRLHVDDQPDQAQCPVCSLLHDYWSGRALPTMEQAMSARREDVETTREAEIVKEESQ